MTIAFCVIYCIVASVLVYKPALVLGLKRT